MTEAQANPKYNEAIKQKIAEMGRVIVLQEGSKKERPYYYTIGNHEKGLPELLLIGKIQEDYGVKILTDLSNVLNERGVAFADGEHYNMGGPHDVLIYNTTVVAQIQYTVQTGLYYGHKDYSVQQVVLPDPNGKYPTDKVCHRDYKVPLLRSTVAIMQGNKLRH